MPWRVWFMSEEGGCHSQLKPTLFPPRDLWLFPLANAFCLFFCLNGWPFLIKWTFYQLLWLSSSKFSSVEDFWGCPEVLSISAGTSGSWNPLGFLLRLWHLALETTLLDFDGCTWWCLPPPPTTPPGQGDLRGMELGWDEMRWDGMLPVFSLQQDLPQSYRPDHI